MQGKAKIPTVTPDFEKLLKERVQLFYHLVAKLQDKREGRINSVAFLCKRVKHLDTDGYKMLKKVMQIL